MHRFTRFAVAGLLGAGSCYSVEPMSAPSPAPGTRVAIDINDAGRLALGGSMGPEIRRVEGSLQSKQDNDYLLSVTGVSLLDGSFQAWKGESVRINSDMVSGVYEKKFSKGKTIAFVAAATAVGIALIPGKAWGIGGDDTGPTGPTGETNRRPAGQVLIPLIRLHR